MRTEERTVAGASDGYTSPVKTEASARAEALSSQIDAARSRGEPTRVARLLVEQALLAEASGDRVGARAAYQAASDENPELLAAIRGARRTADDPHERLLFLDRELRLCPEPERALLLVERARVLEACGVETQSIVDAWQAARAAMPEHDAALVGVHRALVFAGDEPELAAHHARLARQSSPVVAAAHLTLRGRIFESSGDDAAAASAYRDALVLHDVPGLSRDGLARVLSRRGSFAELRALRVEDADRSKDRATRVRRLYEAARLSQDRLDDPTEAIALLRRAHDDAGDDEALDARVIEELVRLLEEQGDSHGAAAARRARIARETVPALRALEERRLARELEILNDPMGAVDAWERARALEPLDELSLSTLDRLLATVGRDERRLALWTEEATRATDASGSTRAYVRAAAIADGTLGQEDVALRLLSAAWATRPGDEDALDGQVRILARGESRDAGRLTNAIDVLVHAAELATDVALRVAHLEKAASLAEELDWERAASLYERVLALAPTRRFALVALQRALHRAGAHAALARVLEREAEQTTDGDHAIALRLRAAEIHHRDARDLERAVSTLRRVLESRPEHQGALLELLACHEEVGRIEEAREILRKLVTLRPNDRVMFLSAIADVSLRLGDLEAAIDALREVLAQVPEHAVATVDLARVLRRAGRFREAAELGERLDPVLAAELWEGRVHDDARAEALFRQVLERDPSNATARDGLLRVTERKSRTLDDLGASGELAAWMSRLELAWSTSAPTGVAEATAHLFPLVADDARAQARLWEARFAVEPTFESARALRHFDRGALELLLRSPDDVISVLAALGESEPSCAWASRLSRALVLPAGAEALGHARAALALDGASPIAIARTIELASQLADREALLLGERHAADIALEPAERIRHLLSAAAVARDLASDDATALIDAALVTDPESVAAATAATQHLIGGDPPRLLELLSRAAFAASRPERIVALAREAAALADALGDAGRACALLGRARAVDPLNVAVLVELGDALRTREAWAESGRVLDEAVANGSESHHREWLARAHRALADLNEGALSDPLRTIIALRALIRLVPDDVGARRRLARVLGGHGQAIEADQILTALVNDPAVSGPERLAVLEQLAGLRVSQHDRTGAELAMRERLRLDPDPQGESFRALARFHQEHLRGDDSLADTLAELVVDARADTGWLLPLAELELRLGRERAAILHLRMASRMLPDDRVALIALAGALSSIAEHDEAAKLLQSLILRDPTQPEVLAARERALLGTSASDEAAVVAELRAWLGHDDGSRYRARRSRPSPARDTVLDEQSVEQWVVPHEADRGALQTLRIVGRSIGKVVAPSPLASHGVAARDRITAKSGHPLRALVDRFSAMLGLEKVEVYIRDAREGGIEIEPLDPPAMIVPSHVLSWPELEIVFAVARALSRLGLGALAFDKLGARGAATAIAAAVAPFGGTLPVIDAEDLERRLNKALDRPSRRSLESIARSVAPFDPEAFARAIEQGAIRVAYLLTGDLGSALTAVRRTERTHVAEVGRAGSATGDLIRFALGEESVTLRRRLGTVWSD